MITEPLQTADPIDFDPYDPRLSPSLYVDGATGCWEWTGSRDAKGYGLLRRGPNRWRAHRYVWTLTNGPIPDGLVVMHACDNPPCCNPEHLDVGTQQQNISDMYARGRAPRHRAFKGRKSAPRPSCCPKGHPYAGDNLVLARGRSYCRACSNARHAIRAARRVACPVCTRESTRGNLRRHLATVHGLVAA